MSKFLPLILLLFFSHSVFPVQATVYKWVDENGVVHYSQDMPKDQAAEEIQVNEAYKPVENNRSSFDKQSNEANQSSQTVGTSLKGLDCNKAVRNATKLMLDDLKKNSKGESNLFIRTMSQPDFIPGGIKRCQRDSAIPAKAASWLCQQKATSASQIQRCEK